MKVRILNVILCWFLSYVQWYLLKELLDTRTCHSLLIPESESEAWVEGTLTGRQGTGE